MSHHPPPPESPEARFDRVFAHFDPMVAYAARRGSRDPEAIAAETMAIAWRRLSVVPAHDPRPWLFVTARNLLSAERRNDRHDVGLDETGPIAQAEPVADPVDPQVAAALLALSPADREVLLLVAWDDLTPSQGALVIGTSAVAFRVRLLRARRRFQQLLDRREIAGDRSRLVEMESA